jgi:hypothetical protein
MALSDDAQSTAAGFPLPSVGKRSDRPAGGVGDDPDVRGALALRFGATNDSFLRWAYLFRAPHVHPDSGSRQSQRANDHQCATAFSRVEQKRQRNGDSNQ